MFTSRMNMGSRSKNRSGGAQTAVAEKKCKRSSRSIQKRGAWKPVQEATDVVSFTGGYNHVESNAKCITLRVRGTNHRFVELKKNNHWFLKGVGGAKALKGDLSCVHVLNVIRDTFNYWEEAETKTGAQEIVHTPTAVAEDREVEFEVDPMDQMDALPSQHNGKSFKSQKKQLRTILKLSLIHI